MSTGLIATVAVAAPLDKTLSYHVPESWREQARIGVRLRVPLGRRRTIGFLLDLAVGETSGLRDIEAILDREPLFSAGMIAFFARAAEYYRHPLGEVIRAALPAGLSGGQDRVGILTERFYVSLDMQKTPTGPRQQEILACLRSEGPMPLSALTSRFGACHAVLRRLTELGFLSEEMAERRRDPFLHRPPGPDRPVVPTPEQEAALEAVTTALESHTFSPFLLHGITGSGKTEVYLRAIAAALKGGRQALVLVPEIALTPQLVYRFRARFVGTARLAVLHSGLSEGERYDAWRAIARGEAEIVIGARSAVFAPLQDPGVIIVDEEHEGAYKQAEGFRYHARDLALMRGQMEVAVVLLGSATPALTSYHRAHQEKAGYLPLTGRAMGQPLPAVEIIDLTADRPQAGTLSESLTGALQENLRLNGQSLLLLNRRGFSPYLLCLDCGAAFRCPNCEITLTYYQGTRLLRCHYCDYRQPPPATCPRCRGGNLHPEGAGTERLEEELTALFPAARIARMDRDTTGRRGAHQDLVERMERGEVDILIGTQMIAKGHDFPRVTLVGVVNADAALNLPDFRSAERAFALLTQVAGRAGRGEIPGRVFIQTWAPEHYAVACAARHDYQGFYRQEVEFRQELGYPPFGHLVNLVFAGIDPERTGRAATVLATELQRHAAGVEILGPAPCPLTRLRGKSRFQVLLKAPRRPPLRRLLAHLDVLRRKVPAGVSLAVDIDPMDML